MIAFGALAGGIGAELSGGNFFKGFVQGGMVAGLNHAVHSIYNSIVYNDKLTQFLKDNGVDPSAKPTQAILDKYKSIFKEYWDSSAKSAEFADSNTIAEWEKGDSAKVAINARGTLTVSSGGDAWGVTNSLGKVILAPGLLSRTNFKLAATFIHEMRHSIDHVSGFYNLIWQLPNVEHIMEYRAYAEARNWTGYMEPRGYYHKANLGYVPSFLLIK